MNLNKTNNATFTNSVIGIDLGSINTKIAAVQKGTVDVITNEANLRQTPTLVAFGFKERLMGETGHAKIKSNLANTIIAPQRYLGFQMSNYTQQEGKHALCSPKEDSSGIIFEVNCHGKKQKLRPEQLTAAFLNKISSLIELNQLTNKYQVVAVPNYLSHNEKRALLHSMSIARESLNQSYGYQLINESTAVGLDYGFYKMNQLPEKEQNAKSVLFIDFGYSKISLYVISFTKQYQKVIFEKHSRQLGCKKIDELMFQYYADLFQKANPNLDISVAESRKATFKLFEGIEKQRKVLSGNSQYDFSIECLLEDSDFSYSMTREQFQEISKPVFEQISSLFQQVKAKIEQLEINLSSIELIGGGSRIPMFIRNVNNSFGMESSRTLNSSQCIARGAALYAAMSSRLFKVKEYYAFDANPFEIVGSWKGESQDIQNQSNVFSLFKQNEILFEEKKLQIDLKPTQNRMLLKIKAIGIEEGVNPQICSFVLNFPEVSENSSQSKVQLTVKLDANKMIRQITAHLKGQKEEPIQVSDLTFYEPLSSEQIKHMVAQQRKFIDQDRKFIETYEKRNEFQSQIYKIKEKLTNATMKQQTKEYIDPSIFDEYAAYLSKLEESIEEVQNYNQVFTECEKKDRQFFSRVEQIKEKYLCVQNQLVQFKKFIEAVVAGHVKTVRFYPGQQMDRAMNWAKLKEEELKKCTKYQQLPLSVEDIKAALEALKQKIEEYQAEAFQKERQAQRYYYQPRPQRFPRAEQNSFHSFNPYRTVYPDRQVPTRRGRNYNQTYDNGFFPRFSGFFD